MSSPGETGVAEVRIGDHIVGVSLETIGSAMRGDIRGVIAGIGKLTKNSKVLAKARDRLARFENLKPIVEAGMEWRSAAPPRRGEPARRGGDARSKCRRSGA